MRQILAMIAIAACIAIPGTVMGADPAPTDKGREEPAKGLPKSNAKLPAPVSVTVGGASAQPKGNAQNAAPNSSNAPLKFNSKKE